MDTKKRIAALESVWITKTGSYNTIINLIAGWFIVALNGMLGFFILRLALAASTPVLFRIVLLLGFISLLLSGIWIWEYLLSCLTIKVTLNGIMVLNLFGYKSVNWNEIKEVYTARGILMPKHFLITENSKICIPTPGMKSIAQLEASIYQHLSPLINTDRMKMSKEGMSIFNRIPRYIAEDQEWFNPKPQNMMTLVCKSFVLLAFFVAMIWKFDIASAIFFFFPVLSSLYNWIKASQARARSVHLYPEGLIVTTSAKSVDMDWEDIAEVEWVNKSTIYIKDVDSEEVFIPVVKTDPESCMLILGFLRGLRDNTHFTLPIPEYILTRVSECPINVKLGRD